MYVWFLLAVVIASVMFDSGDIDIEVVNIEVVST